MTVHDFNPGETWRTDRHRRVEILATRSIEVGYMSYVGVIAFRYHGMSMVHIKPVSELTDWQKDPE